MDRRWLVGLAPGALAAVAVAVVASASPLVREPAWAPPECPGGFDPASARDEQPRAPDDLAGAAWFTLDPVVDAGGTLVGQRLRVAAGARRARSFDLPAESTAGGPFGSVVLAVGDDGARSTLRAVDARSACAWTLGTSRDVVRAATLDHGALAVYEFRVDRHTRADVGVWRRDAGASAPVRVVPPLPEDERFGLTYSTTLTWSEDGAALAVQSCGALLCRVRILDTRTGEVTTLADPAQGELVGLADGVAVAFEPCPGLPCAVTATDVATGNQVSLAADAGLARLVPTDEGPRVAIERGEGTVEVRRLDGTLDRTLGVDPGLNLVPAGDRAGAGVVPPIGWILLAPDGRSPDRAVLARLTDGQTVDLAEVLP